VNIVATLSVTWLFAGLGFNLSTSQSGDTSWELLDLREFRAQGGVLIASKKHIQSTIVAPSLADTVSLSSGANKMP